MEQLQLVEKNGSNYVLYDISGNLNSYTLGEFREKIFESIKRINVVIDLSKIDSIDSAGVGTIMAGFNDGEETRHKLFLMNPSPAARVAIEETGFYDVFRFIHSITEVE